MEDKGRNDLGVAPTLILAVLIAIILKGTLDSFFPALIAGRSLRELYEAWPPTRKTWLRGAQLFVFLILLARFYWGAFRYNQEHAMGKTVGVIIVNLLGTFGLFSLFYVACINVWTIDLFYALILVVHVFDVLWFTVARVRLPTSSPLTGVVGWFIWWDVLTFVAYASAYFLLRDRFWAGRDTLLQVSLLAVLLVISLLDWAVLWDFYFRPEKWCQKAQRAQTVGQAA